jgi:hypothetical protein
MSGLAHADTRLELTEALKDWTTARFALRISHGDYTENAVTFCFNVWIPSAFVLSVNTKVAKSEYLPIAREIISGDAAQKIVDRAAAFFVQATKETGGVALPRAERDETRKELQIGFISMTMIVQVLSKGEVYYFEDDLT